MGKINIETQLNGPQVQAVRTIEGPVLIIAGAGSGKTRVITYRITHMLEKGIPQSAILALTFTNKAAREMETRVKQLTKKKLQNLTVSTFHAFGLKIIREESEMLGYRKNFSIYDETDKQSLIKECLRECRMYSPKINLYELSAQFSKIQTGLVKWAGNNVNDASMQPVYEEYRQAKKIYNAVDFEDLLTIPLELLEKNEEIRKKYQKRFRYILVDEFQDTSIIQYRLLKLLTDSENANVCVVGDDDQSIYSWRGANYENLLLFENDFPGKVEIKLEQNYRSTSAILDAANSVISHNTGRRDKILWTGKDGGKPVELYLPENEKEEGSFIARQIRHLMITAGYKYHDFGVLTRTNSLARNIEEAFLAENIPYRVSGGTSFFQRKEIKDIISYLRITANPNDDVSLLRIINTPRRGIGKTTIASLNEIARKNRSSIWDALACLNFARTQGQQGLFQGQSGADFRDKSTVTELNEFTAMIDSFRSLMIDRQPDDSISDVQGIPRKLSGCIRLLVDKIDYWSYLVLEHSKDEKKARWKFANIEYFIKMVENWENDPDNFESGLYAWLNRISLITKDEGDDDNEGKVNISTIHAAKGLEFPVIFIAGAEKGLIPHERSISEGAEDDESGNIEEERRLFYVAITRAMEKLYITSCIQRRRLQNTVNCEPSPFLAEIPSRLITRHIKENEEISDEQADDFMARIKAVIQH